MYFSTYKTFLLKVFQNLEIFDEKKVLVSETWWVCYHIDNDKEGFTKTNTTLHMQYF